MTYHKPVVAQRVGDGHYMARPGASVGGGLFRGNSGGGDGRGMFWSGARIQVGAVGATGDVPQLVAPVLGRMGLGSYGGGLGDDITKARLAQAKAIAMGLPDPGIPFMVQLNANAARFVRAFAGAIRALPFLSLADKQRLIATPIDALINLFDPIEDFVGNAVDRVLSQKGNVQTFPPVFGKKINLQRVQQADLKVDPSSRNLIKRLRTILAFTVLQFSQPLEIAFELAKELGRNVGLKGYSMRGLGAGAVDDAAAAAVAPVVEAAAPAWVPMLIDAITTILTAATGGLITAGTGVVTSTLLKPKDVPPGTQPQVAPPVAPPPSTTIVTQPSGGIPTTALLVGGAVLVGALVLSMRKKS